ncbi:DEAD/DEAH box helicase [Sphingobacteriaceae bacterium WQ 2009]|uniref:DEAD/DEAH box helicase n=1 Tax=Rhinopithecimicrobium faecis TaxID=2820698 RepID=A0A8T4HBP7_9SPHI|nr:DEAD/DEAH box helicase [Sphingobacteriaceae bacterium WQ 2009]
MAFEHLGLSSYLIASIKQAGLTQPAPIQELAVPKILDGQHLMAIAPTGSGKTASYVWPILNQLQEQKILRNRAIHSLVLVPTRELADQVLQEFNTYKLRLKREIKTMAVYGGVSINPQMKAMLGVEILIATPGRLLDLLEKNALSLSNLQFLVIDEADKLLYTGFEEELDRILKSCPKKLQTLLFSATKSQKIEAITARIGVVPTCIEVEGLPQAKEQLAIKQVAYQVSEERKGPFLRYLIKSKQVNKVLIFVSAIHTAEKLMTKLKRNKILATTINSQKSQSARLITLEEFKRGKIQVLIATDLIGRGIHIEELETVINYELPRSPQDYIHRIGRTGRAGKEGVAISLISPEEEQHFALIQKKNKLEIPLLSTEEVNLHGY